MAEPSVASTQPVVVEPVVEPVVDPKAKVEPVVVVEPVVDPKAKVEPVVDPKAKVEPVVDPKVKADDKTKADPDWASLRTKLAKGDEKLEKRLARYSSVESAIEALVAAQDKIAKGVHKEVLAEDATDEEKAAWREQNGVPAKPEDYKIELTDGLVVGEADQPIVDKFLEYAHGKNLPTTDVNDTLSWYFAQQEAEAQQQAVTDNKIAVDATGEVKDLWGTEYELNKNLIIGMLDAAPTGVKENIMNARMPDGTPVMSHVPTLRWLADVAREANPTATIIPNSGTNQMQTIKAEMDNLKAIMGDKTSEYWVGPKAQGHQDRYKQLIDVNEKLKTKSALT